MKPLVLTVIPTRGLLYTDATAAMQRELDENNQPPSPIYSNGRPLPGARNELVENALKVEGWTHLLLLDDDVIMPEGSLKAMLDLEADIALVDYPHHLIGEKDGKDQQYGVAVYDDWKEGDDVTEKTLAWAGLGCVLVKREVFEKVKSPWFQSTNYQFQRDNGKIMFNPESKGTDSLEEIKGSGEDTHFYLEARKEGLSIKVVPDMVAGHCRIEKMIMRMQDGRYQRSHTIRVNDRIDGRLM
jgi:hypothetical protein